MNKSIKIGIISCLKCDALAIRIAWIWSDCSRSFAILSCRSAWSTSKCFEACEIMKEFGFNNVFNLDGGFLKWVECGFEVSE